MTKIVDTLINDRYPLRVTADRHDFHRVRPEWESKRLESCVELMEPGMTVYDLGAESGDFTALYRSWVGPSGLVVAVEPSPPYWPSIRQTWEANDFGPPPAWFSGFVSDVTDLTPPLDEMADQRENDGTGWPQSSNGDVIPDFGFRHLCQQADSTPQVTIDDLAGWGRPTRCDRHGHRRRRVPGPVRRRRGPHRPPPARVGVDPSAPA